MVNIMLQEKFEEEEHYLETYKTLIQININFIEITTRFNLSKEEALGQCLSSIQKIIGHFVKVII